MKKAVVILLVGLFWCEISFAISQESLVKQYLSGRKLDLIEGVWADIDNNIKIYASYDPEIDNPIMAMEYWNERWLAHPLRNILFFMSFSCGRINKFEI